ncbi:MAG: hypothetical protein ACXVFZ_08810 [Blastococcus sp.]
MWRSRRRIQGEMEGAPVADDALPYVHVSLWRDDAIVLYDWLMSADLNAVPITHRAQKQALVDLLNRLEQDTDVLGVTEEEITRAQEAVAKDMGW